MTAKTFLKRLKKEYKKSATTTSSKMSQLKNFIKMSNPQSWMEPNKHYNLKENQLMDKSNIILAQIRQLILNSNFFKNNLS